jgi:hypothetical protein
VKAKTTPQAPKKGIFTLFLLQIEAFLATFLPISGAFLTPSKVNSAQSKGVMAIYPGKMGTPPPPPLL